MISGQNSNHRSKNIVYRPWAIFQISYFKILFHLCSWHMSAPIKIYIHLALSFSHDIVWVWKSLPSTWSPFPVTITIILIVIIIIITTILSSSFPSMSPCLHLLLWLLFPSLLCYNHSMPPQSHLLVPCTLICWFAGAGSGSPNCPVSRDRAA